MIIPLISIAKIVFRFTIVSIYFNLYLLISICISLFLLLISPVYFLLKIYMVFKSLSKAIFVWSRFISAVT